MQSVFKFRKQKNLEEIRSVWNKTHFGIAEATEVLAANHAARKKTPTHVRLASKGSSQKNPSRSDDSFEMVTSQEIVPSHHWLQEHMFRSRNRGKELCKKDLYNWHYEPEKERIPRVEAEMQYLQLSREAWFAGQHGPALPPACRKWTSSTLRSQSYTDAERIKAAVQDVGMTDLDVGGRYRPVSSSSHRRAEEPVRRSHSPGQAMPATCPTERPLNHAMPATGAWEPTPVSHATAGDPYVDRGRILILGKDAPRPISVSPTRPSSVASTAMSSKESVVPRNKQGAGGVRVKIVEQLSPLRTSTSPASSTSKRPLHR
eukprot:gnl/TRDRNA2_/TRDRNA2_129492_c0_seq1.p1 gnl/TRDRNA2_/TRDRNA2_129492_c0~~gnl/TRDRNA2_/TRDRNA2_129492_c0_seq1.p1  ORF type:complete len:317 (-),score=48.46 gnl/TRDRNA2_/TRDRNA2_129492_c0_seq1:54-1004(-)